MRLLNLIGIEIERSAMIASAKCSTHKSLLAILSAGFLILTCALVSPFFSDTTSGSAQPGNLYVGVDVAFNNITATKLLIDRVSPFTNLFVIGCLGDYDETRLDLISEYLHDKGLYFIVYSDSYWYPSKKWFERAGQEYGDKFLGIYYFDEMGGKVLDQGNGPIITSAINYADAAQKFNTILSRLIRGNLSVTRSFSRPDQYRLFTSDYALYWFDYKAGYDVVLAQFGWNNSRQLNVALCRGAATAFGKDWGVIITWTFRHEPYIESGSELYEDMVLAYENGAKYILVFDSNEDYSESTLREEHFEAMERFWQYDGENSRVEIRLSERVAYVLPQDYAYGFRGEHDKIWGLWEPDSMIRGISADISLLLEKYGTGLDIVYPDGRQTGFSGYKHVFYWDGRQNQH